LPKKRKVDTSILTYARKKLKCTGNSGSSTATGIHLLSDATTDFVGAASSGGSLALVAYMPVCWRKFQLADFQMICFWFSLAF